MGSHKGSTKQLQGSSYRQGVEVWAAIRALQNNCKVVATDKEWRYGQP